MWGNVGIKRDRKGQKDRRNVEGREGKEGELFLIVRLLVLGS